MSSAMVDDSREIKETNPFESMMSRFDRALRREVVDELAQRFRALGFRYVTLDLHGYRTGAMNEILKNSDK